MLLTNWSNRSRNVAVNPNKTEAPIRFRTYASGHFIRKDHHSFKRFDKIVWMLKVNLITYNLKIT